MIRRILQALVVVLAPAIAQTETFKTVAFPGGPGEANKLNYGQRWSGGPFACDSAKSGLTCKRNDGHGFEISRQAIKLY